MCVCVRKYVRACVFVFEREMKRTVLPVLYFNKIIY